MTVPTLDRGNTGRIGLGGAPWSVGRDADDSRALDVIATALAAGLTLIDTACAYTTHGVEGHNEKLIATALADVPASSRPLVATKGGHFRQARAPEPQLSRDGDTWPIDGRPATIKAHCAASRRHLGVDTIDLYQLHWPDPAVPILESVGAIEELRQAGQVARIGVSNVSPDQLRSLLAAFPISSVQNRLDAGDPTLDEIITLCEEAGIVFFGYSPLGGNSAAAGALGDDPDLAAVAHRHEASAPQVVLAYWLARSPAIVPLVGARRPASIEQSLRAVTLTLDDDDLARCRAALDRRGRAR